MHAGSVEKIVEETSSDGRLAGAEGAMESGSAAATEERVRHERRRVRGMERGGRVVVVVVVRGVHVREQTLEGVAVRGKRVVAAEEGAEDLEK